MKHLDTICYIYVHITYQLTETLLYAFFVIRVPATINLLINT